MQKMYESEYYMQRAKKIQKYKNKNKMLKKIIWIY